MEYIFCSECKREYFEVEEFLGDKFVIQKFKKRQVRSKSGLKIFFWRDWKCGWKDNFIKGRNEIEDLKKNLMGDFGHHEALVV